SAMARAEYEIAISAKGSKRELEALKRKLELERDMRLEQERLTQEEIALIDEEYRMKAIDLDRDFLKTRLDNIFAVFQKMSDLLGNVLSGIDNREKASL